MVDGTHDAAAAAGGDGKVVLIGVAQEKTPMWRSWPAKGQENKPHPHMEWGRQTAFVNHYYFYLWEPRLEDGVHQDQRLWPLADLDHPNGHEWAKRQLEIAGISYEASDNGFRSCAALQCIRDRLSPEPVRNFYWRWFNGLPSPLTHDDLTAGYGYDLAFRQFEVSDTRVFERPAAGRAFFEVSSETTQNPPRSHLWWSATRWTTRNPITPKME